MSKKYTGVYNHDRNSTLECRSLCILLPFGSETKDQIRRIDGRQWYPKEKVWSFPDTDTIRQVLLIFLYKTIRVHLALDHPYLTNELALKKEIENKHELKKSQIQVLAEHLKLKGYSKHTQKSYIHHVERFESFNPIPVTLIQKEHIHNYMLHLLEKQLSHSFVNQASRYFKPRGSDTAHSNNSEHKTQSHTLYDLCIRFTSWRSS